MPNKKLITSLDQINDLNGYDKKLYRHIFSDKAGIINGLLRRYDFMDYRLSVFQSLTAHTKVLCGHSREVSSGGLGIHQDPRIAFHACIGESLERYCMSFYNTNDLVFCRAKDLPADMRLGDFSLYTNKQYEHNPIFANPSKDGIHWLKVNSLFNKKRGWWPASSVYLPFEAGKNSAETTSTGIAAHFSKEQAIVNGVLELMERDALMINFLQRINPPEIAIESINKENQWLIKKIKSKYNFKLYKLFSDINIPIYAGFIWKKNNTKLHYGIGASASINSSDAIEKTIKECLFTYQYSRDMLDLKPSRKDKIKALYEHFLYYQDEKLHKLFFKSKVVEYKEELYSKNHLIDELKKNNLEVFYKELTTPDIVSTGIRVFRVIIPGLVDLNKSHKLRREGALRLWDVPLKLGLKTPKKLSPLPHPFP